MDNPLDQEETPNRVAHIHHYVLKGSGLSCWAECDDETCREKLGDNGAIVGSRRKVETAVATALEATTS